MLLPSHKKLLNLLALQDGASMLQCEFKRHISLVDSEASEATLQDMCALKIVRVHKNPVNGASYVVALKKGLALLK